jgi:hypothetical protein
MFFVTISIVRPGSSLGLTSTTSVPAQDGRVYRADVVGVARLEQLLVAARAEADLPADHVAHVLALALVVREPLEERGKVGVLRVRLEADRLGLLESVGGIAHRL